MSHRAMMILAQMLVPRTCSVSTMKLGVTLVLILTVASACLVVNERETFRECNNLTIQIRN